MPLLCRCGSPMELRPNRTPEAIERDIDALVGKPPRHRKRRIQKKWLKRYEANRRIKGLPIRIAAPLAGKAYVCTACGTKEGMYAALGRNIVHVEPLDELTAEAQKLGLYP